MNIFQIIDISKNSVFCLLFLWWILEPFFLVDSRTLMDSRLFLEASVFCFLFSRSRCVLLLDTFASRIICTLQWWTWRWGFVNQWLLNLIGNEDFGMFDYIVIDLYGWTMKSIWASELELDECDKLTKTKLTTIKIYGLN